MIDSLIATNMDSAEVVTLNDAVYPLTRFAWNYSMKGDGEPKMRRPGRHKRLSQIDTMTIEMVGSILVDIGSSYWTARNDLLKVLLPHPDQLELNHVRFDLDVADAPFVIHAEAVLRDLDVPVEALSPTRSTFQFQWEVPEGYWLDSGGSPVYI